MVDDARDANGLTRTNDWGGENGIMDKELKERRNYCFDAELYKY